MFHTISLLLVLLAISPAPSAPPPGNGRNHRVSRDTSDRMIFMDESEETDGNSYAGRAGNSWSRTTTTVGPAMTFRGGAPSSRDRTLPRADATTPTSPATTHASWLRKFVPTAVPNFIDRVGEFFGKKKKTAVPMTTEATTPLLETSDERLEHARDRSSNATEVDIRVMIDAPAISGDCPSGHRMQGGMCRRRL